MYRKLFSIGLSCLMTLFVITHIAYAQAKITGPWLWMIAPTAPGQGGAASIDIDSLAVASGGAVTEADVAVNGANEGDRVGNFVWTLGQISATSSDNINDCINRIGLAAGNVDDHSSYALFTLESDTVRRDAMMRVGSDDAIKVWLNGEVVHNNPVDRGASDFQDALRVDLLAGNNLLMVKVSERGGDWSMFVGIDSGGNAGGAQGTGPTDASDPGNVGTRIVDIPDANLRAAIEAALGKASGATITVDKMATLTGLDAQESNIRVLTGLEFATNLTWLWLWGNNISDISPLVANTGLGKGDTVDVRGNPLSYLSLPIHTHIPTLQSRGVTVEFNDRTHLNVGEPYTVRLIYFLPSDRQPQPDIDTQMDKLIKDVQQVFARGMEQHGFGRKTFTFEADTTGKAVVHHVNGQFTAKYYYEISGLRGSFDKVAKEIYEQFDTSRNIYLVIVDIDNFGGIATLGIGMGGIALVGYNAEFHGFRVLSVHELRHTFGFGHSNQYITSIGRLEPSKCTAEFLDVHRFFNATPQSQKFHNNTTIEMLSPSFAAPPDAIRVRFEVADPDGLHQARLHAPEVGADGGFLACKRLTGTRSVVEFVTTVLLPRTRFVSLQVIDVHGNISWSGNQPIDVTSLLPPDKMVSIPDANLASAVREALDLAPGTALTSHAILDLTEFSAPNSGITDLTGLEHAHNLRYLHLANTTVSDVSPLSALTQLRHLHLANTAVSDVSPLSALTQLRDLGLNNTAVSDVSPLSALTQLIFLYLNNTAVSDVSPLSALTQLIQLYLNNTAVSDVSPLVGTHTTGSPGSCEQLHFGYICAGGVDTTEYAVA